MTFSVFQICFIIGGQARGEPAFETYSKMAFNNDFQNDSRNEFQNVLVLVGENPAKPILKHDPKRLPKKGPHQFPFCQTNLHFTPAL